MPESTTVTKSQSDRKPPLDEQLVQLVKLYSEYEDQMIKLYEEFLKNLAEARKEDDLRKLEELKKK